MNVETTRDVKMTQQQEDNISMNVGDDNAKNILVGSVNENENKK